MLRRYCLIFHSGRRTSRDGTKVGLSRSVNNPADGVGEGGGPAPEHGRSRDGGKEGEREENSENAREK